MRTIKKASFRVEQGSNGVKRTVTGPDDRTLYSSIDFIPVGNSQSTTGYKETENTISE